MTDLEINRAVAERLGLDITGVRPPAILHSLAIGPRLVRDMSFDPCNYPGDAWPVIVDNGINIDFETGFADHWVEGGVHSCAFFGDHKGNPLRAAMACYLDMGADDESDGE